MNHLFEKVAYLKGLVDGLNIEESSKEGKILLNIIDTLDDFAEAIVALDEEQEDIAEYIEALDEDLSELEDELYEDDDIDFMEIHCPNCDEHIYVDEYLYFDEDPEITCPNCNYVINLDEECGCGIDGCHEHMEEDE
ncbi:MAG: hypothetical protein GX214_00955 [Clostridiales bacterium]|nr:hypothetical protein [Clostridiales bacterium]